MGNEELTNEDFRHTAIYSQLKPHLSKNAIKAVEGSHTQDGIQSTIVVVGESRMSGVNPFRNSVLDELSLLESRWRLL